MCIFLKSKDEFFSEVSQERVLDSKRKALVFIHGFNNSFEDVARRTAQIAYDSKFKGVPIFYSWPSKGRLGKKAYDFDGNELLQAILYLKQFLRDIATKGAFDSITLIAHSMGNRALTEAFISLKNDLKVTELKVFKEIILAAPDIDADYFRNSIAPALVNTTATTTLYASSKDLALIESKKHNGAPRAGDSGTGLIVIDGIETIDATNADTNLFWGANHAYIADSKELLTDLFYLIEGGKRAGERYLDPVPTKEHPEYWKLKK
jgi:esterase/lipase superfamily enzyme